MDDRIRCIKQMGACSVQETTDTLGSVIQDRDLAVFAKMHHTHNAVGVGMRLTDAQVISFGNPALGPIRMQETVFLPLDLPLRVSPFFTVVQGLRGAGNYKKSERTSNYDSC